jgi:hypothetical protein
MFVGIKMLIAPWIKVPILFTLTFIVAALVLTAIVSLLWAPRNGDSK